MFCRRTVSSMTLTSQRTRVRRADIVAPARSRRVTSEDYSFRKKNEPSANNEITLRQHPGQAAGAYPLLMVRVCERYSNHHVVDLARSALPHRDGTKLLILRAGHPCRTAPYGSPLMSAMNTSDASRGQGPPDLGICLILRYGRDVFVC